MHMENLRMVEIVFENCESIEIPYTRFNNLTCENETKYDDPLERNTYTCDEMTMEIKYNSSNDLEYSPLHEEYPLGMFIGNPVSNKVEDRPNVLGRLLHFNDIVNIELHDDNANTKTVYAPWGEDEYQNTCMKLEVLEDMISIKIK
jgi:hypothetical protein